MEREELLNTPSEVIATVMRPSLKLQRTADQLEAEGHLEVLKNGAFVLKYRRVSENGVR